jgi:hypothetical protein
MGQDSVVTVYKDVIEDVLKSVSHDLIQEYGDNAYNALRHLWIQTLINKGVLNSNTELLELQMSIAQPPHHMIPQHHAQQYLPQPVQGTGLMGMGGMMGQQGAPQMHHLPAGMHPTSLSGMHGHGGYPALNQSAMHTLPQTLQSYPYENYAQTRPQSAASLPNLVGGTHQMPQNRVGRPAPLINPMQNIDGHFDEEVEEKITQQQKADIEIENQIQNPGFVIEFEAPKPKKSRRLKGHLPQYDGEGDDEEEENEEGEEEEQENEGGNEESLNSGLDSSGDEEQEVFENLVVCLYDKVTRAKNKWRCVLKEGVMHLDRKDYVFQKATGEFEW